VGPYCFNPTLLGGWDTGPRPEVGRTRPGGGRSPPGGWDTTRLVERRGIEEPPQPPTGALGDLAVALEGPAELLAELSTAHPKRDLAGEHQPLVVAQQRRKLGYPL
jgi:hypothetical protein